MLGQREDILPIERGNERPVQPVDDGVGNVITLVLNRLDRLSLSLHVGVIIKEILKHACGAHYVLRGSIEQVEERFLAGKQSQPH